MSYHSFADRGGCTDRRSVQPEPERPVFHAEWERRVLALALAMGATGLWTLDRSRSVRETLDDYATLSYYEIWLTALEKLLIATGAIHSDELASGTITQAPLPVTRVLRADAVARVLAQVASTARDAARPARFTAGDRVRTRDAAPPHHTRLPQYARGKRGIVERVHGTHVFADTNAQGLGERPQWLYTVAFEAAELWGPPAAQPASAATDCVSIDAWESYLERA